MTGFGIQSPNFLAAYGEGVKMREAQTTAANRNALTSALQAGDMGAARNAFAAVNPEAAYTAMQPAKRDPKEIMAFAGQLTRAVLSADPAIRGDVYQEALQLAAANGADISGLPETYDEQSVMVMDRLFNMQDDERTALQRELEMLPEAMREDALMVHFGLKPKAANPADRQDPIAALRSRAAEAGLQPGSPEYRQFMMDGGAKSGMALDVGPNGEVSLRTGGAAGDAAFGKSATNTLEGGILTDSDLIQRGARLMQDYKPEYLTYQGQFESFVTKQAEKLGRDPGEVRKEALKGRQRFVMGIEQLFNQYRKEITGAAAAVAELDRLKKSFINMDMSPSEFEAGMELFMEESARALRLKRRLLREGVPGTDLGKLLDDAFLAGQDDDPAARFGEIMQEVGDEEEAYRRLAAEGYSL